MRIKKHIIFFLLFSVFFSAGGWAENPVWILVDTDKLTVEVKRGNTTILLLKNISIGRNGAGFKQHIGDDITPKGSYKISWINNKSPFYRFFGFNYPSIDNANEALLSGLISKEVQAAIVNAHLNNRIPPQNTRIGGQIGIHGLGQGDEKIHKMMNWTQGCIALENKQIDRLAQWIKKGTKVIVK